MLAIASSSVSLEPARVEFWGDGVGRFNAPRLTHTQRAKHSKKGAECDDLTHPPVPLAARVVRCLVFSIRVP